FGEREVAGQRLHKVGRPLVFKAHLHELVQKYPAAEGGIRVQHRSRDEAGGFVEGDAVIGVNDATAKLDGRDVPLARGAQAEDETEFAFGHTSLVRMRNDGGIEQRGGLQSILAGEERAEIELPGLGERAPTEDVRLDPLEMPLPNGVQ